MSAVISEGVPLDGSTGRIFEPPQVNQDNTRPRYLTFLGSFITPEVAVQRPWTARGGFEIANPCLRYARHFLQKGRITPLLRDTHDFLPYDYVRKTTDIDPLSAGYFAQQIPKGYVPPHLPPPNGQPVLAGGSLGMGGYSPYGTMVGKLALPGEQIRAILDGDDNVDRNFGRRGVVEITSLTGHEYHVRPIALDNGATVEYDPELWEIQRTVFPSYPLLPTKLDEIDQLLDAATIHTSLLPIIDDYRESVSQFRNHIDIYIQNVHQQMRERGPNGYVRPYTAGDLVLLDQIGMERQDRATRQVTSAAVDDIDLREALKQLVALQIEEKQANLERKRRLAEIPTTPTVNASTMAAGPITETPKTYTCEHCNEEVKTAGKGLHVGRYCKVLHPKTDA